MKNLKSFIKKRLKKFFKKTSSYPSRIVIELTNRCNLNCPYCLVGMQNEQESVAHADLGRPWGQMDINLAEKIMRDARDFGMKEVMLTFQGEPLLHDRFVDIIHLAKKYGLKAVVFTNGLLLDAQFSRNIIRAGLDSIRFSVDGLTEETYQKNRVGGTFQKVFQNMKDMAQIAREEKSDINITWQFIALRNNEHEIPQARKKAKEIGVSFLVKTFAESIPELTPRNSSYRRNLQLKPCTDIYRMFCVYWNGDVVPCCYDVSGKEILGNVNDKTLREIWESPRYMDFRRRVDQAVRNPGEEPFLCRSCLKWGLPQKRKYGNKKSQLSIKDEKAVAA